MDDVDEEEEEEDDDDEGEEEEEGRVSVCQGFKGGNMQVSEKKQNFGLTLEKVNKDDLQQLLFSLQDVSLIKLQ